jgi:hypothetical protein
MRFWHPPISSIPAAGEVESGLSRWEADSGFEGEQILIAHRLILLRRCRADCRKARMKNGMPRQGQCQRAEGLETGNGRHYPVR